MHRTNYVCVNFCGNTSVLIVFEFVRGAIVSRWHAYLCLSSAQLCPNLTYARMCAQVHFHVCTADILQCVRACVQKRKKEKQRANVYMKEWEHVYACGRLSPTEVHPTLVRARCRVTQVSNGKQRIDTHAHTYTVQDAELSWGQSQQMSWSELARCVF